MHTILTDIRVVGKELRLSLEGLGSFAVTDYLHTFPLKRVPLETITWAVNELSWRERLRGLECRIVSSFVDVVQVDGPLKVAQAKCFTLQQLKQHIVHHPRVEENALFAQKMFDYLIENPPQKRKPFTIENLLEHLYAHPNVQRRHHHTIDALLGILEEGWPIHSGNVPKDKTPKVMIPSPLPKEFFRGNYSQLARWKIAPKGSVVDVDESLVGELKSGKREIKLRNRIIYVSQRTASEILNLPMAFVDIEKPLFGTDREEISWTALTLTNRGTLNSYVASLYTLPSMINGFSSVPCVDESTLVEKVKQLIAPTRVFVAYNVPFDAIQLREAGEFTIGEDEEEPKKIATLKFFERIGVKGKDVLDLLRWARIQYDYLPNKKLQTVAKHVLGEGHFQKSITYEQQAELEALCQGRDIEVSPKIKGLITSTPPAEIIANYVTNDARVLVELTESKAFRHAVEDVAFMGELFRIDPFLMLHDAKRIQDYLERKFFEKAGIFRDGLHPRFAVFTKYEQKVKQKLMRVLERSFPARQEGLQHNVVKAYLPLGRVLRQDVRWFYPEAKQFYAYVDQFRNDPQRRFFLARYEDALAEWMWKDYAAYAYERDKLRKMIPDTQRRKQFRDYCGGWKNRLHAHGLEEKLTKAAIAQKDILPLMTNMDHEYLAQRNISFGDFFREFRQWCKVQQKNRILWGSWEAGWDTFEERLTSFCGEVNKFLQQKGMEIVHTQNKYLYVKGNMKAMYEPDSLVIPVDEIEKAYVADSIYYQRHGAWHGLKWENKPTHTMNVYEMDVVGEFLDKMMEDNVEEALESLWLNLDTLACRKVPKEELVWQTRYSGKYRTYENGDEIHFYEWRPEEQVREKVLKGKEMTMEREHDAIMRRDYVNEPYYEGKDIVYKTRWLLSPAAFEPDWKMYEEKMVEKVKGLVKPLLGKEAEQFARDALSREIERKLKFYVEKLPKQREMF